MPKKRKKTPRASRTTKSAEGYIQDLLDPFDPDSIETSLHADSGGKIATDDLRMFLHISRRYSDAICHGSLSALLTFVGDSYRRNFAKRLIEFREVDRPLFLNWQTRIVEIENSGASIAEYMDLLGGPLIAPTAHGALVLVCELFCGSLKQFQNSQSSELAFSKWSNQQVRSAISQLIPADSWNRLTIMRLKARLAREQMLLAASLKTEGGEQGMPSLWTKWLRAAEAQSLLGITSSTLSRWVKDHPDRLKRNDDGWYSLNRNYVDD